MDNVVHILEPDPQNFASKGYIHRTLQEILAGTLVPKNALPSLNAAVHTAINGSTTLPYSRRIQHSAILPKRDLVENFVNTTVRELESNTFRPEKYTDPKGSRKFSLLPIFSMQAGHIALNKETLHTILRRAGLGIPIHCSEEDFLRVVWQILTSPILGTKVLRISSHKTWSGGKSSQTDILSMSRQI
ncbi:hypothetical protein Unana1_00720 [Umbelopsis nana]